MNNSILVYQHTGSKNHGCEALVRTIFKNIKYPITICSNDRDSDCKYLGEELGKKIVSVKQVKKWSLQWFIEHLIRALHINFLPVGENVDVMRYSKDKTHCIAIGGDVYCYKMGHVIWPTDYKLKKKGKKMALIGCSLEPKDLKKGLAEHLNCFDLITARESITYDALLNLGLDAKCQLVPDSAFFLDKVEKPFPEYFDKGKIIGINVSPIIIKKEKIHGIVMENYRVLINYLLEKTDYNIMLIPHVVETGSNDSFPLRQLFEDVNDSNRICLIEDDNCKVLKGYISKCHMFIGARTHATIAAYSSCVPTLVIGYSVKANGIAKDLFDDVDNYVLSVKKISNSNDLLNKFIWLERKSSDIRNHLEGKMPSYIDSSLKIHEILNDWIE